jgi:hypothetical protein
MINTRTDIHKIADRFVAALESGDEAELVRLYHPQLRFAIPTIGAEYDRAHAPRNARMMRGHLRDVEVELVDRQIARIDEYFDAAAVGPLAALLTAA